MATKKQSKKKTKGSYEPFEGMVIYSLIPTFVEFPVHAKQGKKSHPKVRSVYMEYGRRTAQHGHAVSKMRVDRSDRYHNLPITTIALSVRNSREMFKLADELRILIGDEGVFQFEDKNPDFYGTTDEVPTAVVTIPVFPYVVQGVTGHLELLRPTLDDVLRETLRR